MNKLIKIFLYEYTRHVFRKRFFIALISVPLFIVVVLAVSIFASFLETNTKPLGYVDQVGILAHPVHPRQSALSSSLRTPLEIRAYPTEESARAALDAGEIQAYYVLPQDYLSTSKVRLVAYKMPANEARDQFRTFIKANLIANQAAAVIERITEGDEIIAQSLDGTRQMSTDNWINIVVPFVTGVLFMMVAFTAGGYLMQAVVEEKENRTMEVIITSVSPGQLMAGKTLGNMSVGLTQILFWIVPGLALVGFAGSGLLGSQRVQIDKQYWTLMLVVFLAAFVLLSALMATLGATLTENQEAQQFSSLFTLPVMAPYWVAAAIINSPNSPLSIGLSLFPLTAPVTLTLRGAFTTVPIWQFLASIAILIVCSVGALWMAGRAFRLGMLRYGKRLTWREIFSRTA